MEAVGEQGANENIWSWKRESNRRMMTIRLTS
jgi:hypothetical protein